MNNHKNDELNSQKKFLHCPECGKKAWGRFSKGIFTCSENEHMHVVPIKDKEEEKRIDNLLNSLLV